MTIPPPTAERVAPEPAAALARQAVTEFPWCFWFRAKDAPVCTVGDVHLVVQRLRQHGGRTEWARAFQIEQSFHPVQ